MGRLTSLLKKIREIYLFSDSQPTEITLAVCLAVLAPIVITIEIGFMPILLMFIMFTGIFQLYCVSIEDIKCRMRSATLSVGGYLAVFLIYVIKGTIFVSPTHWGWFVLAFSSWGVFKRLNAEFLHRQKR